MPVVLKIQTKTKLLLKKMLVQNFLSIVFLNRSDKKYNKNQKEKIENELCLHSSFD